MALHRPDSLEYQLCRLFDSGRCDVDAFARLADERPYVIELAARGGTKLGREVDFRIRRVLALFHRKYPELKRDEARPALSRSVFDASQGEIPPRGVYEDPPSFPGFRTFSVFSDDKECLCQVRWPNRRATPEKIEGLWRMLDKENPLRTLKAI